MDTSELESYQNIIYITEEEHRSEWNYESTKELLKIYDEKSSDMLDTGMILTQKKLWELTSKDLSKKGFSYTPAQCENRWKTLKRAYRNKLNKMQIYGSTKRPCPFEYEVAEILSKRPRSYSSKISELKKEEEMFQINLNEPPGFSKDKKLTELNTKYAPQPTEDSQELDTDSNEPHYLVQEENQMLLIEDLCDLKRTLIKQNKIHTHALQQSNNVQEKILECLERFLETHSDSQRIEEKKAKQQEEIAEQLKIQNKLIERLVEKLG